MSLIGTLAVNVIANTAAIEQGLNKARGKVSEFSKSMDSIGMGGAWQAFQGINGALTSIAGELAPVLAIFDAIASAISEGARKADELAESAAKIGTSASSLQGLRAAGEEFGAKSEAIDTALMKLSEQLGQVEMKNTQVAASFQKLGLDAYQLAAMGTAKAFQEIATRIQQIKDPAERNAVLFELFGKQGRELGPLMSEGAAGIEKAIARARELGLVLNEGTIQKAGGINDAAERARQSWENAAKRAAAAWVGNIIGAFHEVSRVAGIAAGDLATGGAEKAEKPKSSANIEAEQKLIRERGEALRQAAEEAAAEEERQKRTAKEFDDMKRKATALAESLRMPDEVFRDTISEYKAMFEKGLLSAENFRRAADKAGELRDKATTKTPDKQIDLASKAMGSQEAFATWARQQNFMGGFKGDENEKKIEKNTNMAVKELEGVKQVLDRIESKPAVTFKVVNL